MRMCPSCDEYAMPEDMIALEEALRDLVEISEIAVGMGMIQDRPDMNGPLPRARALLAKLAENK